MRGDLVESITSAADGEALIVEQLADAPDEQHFVMLVVAAVAAALHRLELREFLFPITQHVRLHTAQITYLADREIALGRNRRKR